MTRLWDFIPKSPVEDTNVTVKIVKPLLIYVQFITAK